MADICLPVDVAAADPIPLVRLWWNCLAHAGVRDVCRMPMPNPGEGVSLNQHWGACFCISLSPAEGQSSKGFWPSWNGKW